MRSIAGATPRCTSASSRTGACRSSCSGHRAVDPPAHVDDGADADRQGLVILVTRNDGGSLEAQVAGFLAIYTAVGVRDADLNAELGKKLMAGAQQWSRITR